MRRSERSAQAAQTCSGITPARIRIANSLQPMQMPNADSSVAATVIVATSTSANVVAPNAKWAINAAVDSTAPMPWAKRFGGPSTSRGASGRAGTTTCVASRPSGLNVGPAATRATKPYASGPSTQVQPRMRTSSVITTTPAATTRAATSFTGFGKRKSRLIRSTIAARTANGPAGQGYLRRW